MCRVLEVSRSGYYSWRSRRPSARQIEDERLSAKLKGYFEESRDSYGARRLREDFLADQQPISRRRCRRLMKQNGLQVRRPKRWVPRTTDSSMSLRIAENHLARDFSAERIDQKWVSDITYISTKQGWLYLAVIIDLCSRKVVGYAMSKSIDALLICEALRMALRGRGRPTELLFHSDRGSQYASDMFLELLSSHGICASMSRRGNCWDNAVSESFFSTLKRELNACDGFESVAEAELLIFEYIEVFYNRKRRHSTIAYCSPDEFERRQGAGTLTQSSVH
jgi:putative transposase